MVLTELQLHENTHACVYGNCHFCGGSTTGLFALSEQKYRHQSLSRPVVVLVPAQTC